MLLRASRSPSLFLLSSLLLLIFILCTTLSLSCAGLLPFFSRSPPPPPGSAAAAAAAASSSSSSLYTIMPKKNNNSTQFRINRNEITTRCVCGKIHLTVPYSVIEDQMQLQQQQQQQQQEAQVKTVVVADCHCRNCRKFHATAFCTFLLIPQQHVTIHNETKVQSFIDSCQQVNGPVERLFCSSCYTKLATRPIINVNTDNGEGSGSENEYTNLTFVNLGAIDDRTIPAAWASQWRSSSSNNKKPSPVIAQQQQQQQATDSTKKTTTPIRMPPLTSSTISYPTSAGSRTQWQWESRAIWKDAIGMANSDNDRRRMNNTKKTTTTTTTTWTGSCACGSCRYKLTLAPGDTTELQHCYCRLCRRLSGGPFQTWMPFDNIPTQFTWTTNPPPPLKRYTSHGRRHVCTNCGNIMTIIYDEDISMIWPAAGTLDDESLLIPAAAFSSSTSTTTDTIDTATLHLNQQHLHSVIHICCKYRQRWYELPNDDNPRIMDAS